MIGFEFNISFKTFMSNTFFKPYRLRVNWEKQSHSHSGTVGRTWCGTKKYVICKSGK